MWPRGRIFLMVGLTIGVWVGLSPVVARSEELGQGKIIYERHCVVCHGSEGKGDGVMGRVLRPLPTDFTSAASKTKPDRELLAAIEHGVSGSAMPAWKGTFSEQEMHEVLGYIRSLTR